MDHEEAGRAVVATSFWMDMGWIDTYTYLLNKNANEAFLVLAFILTIVLVYLAAAGAAVMLFLLNDKKVSHLRKPWLVFVLRGTIAVAAAGTLCIVYGLAIEPYWLEVKAVQLKSTKLAHATRPLRIAHISDLHCDSAPRLEESLPAVIGAQEPDIIVFTGDAVNDREGIPVFKRLMSRLAQIAPTFAVAGNWECYLPSTRELFEGTGVRELKAECVPITIGGDEIWISGVAADRQDYGQALKHVPQERFSVFLNHYSDVVDKIGPLNVDLYLSGHTHGGQVALPFYGAIVTFAEGGKKYESGLYQVGKTHLYVNRGIGMDGGQLPRARFCARPEVTILEVLPQPIRTADVPTS